MSDFTPNFDLYDLSSPEQLELIGQLRDIIPDSTESLELIESHRQELARRLAKADAKPGATIPWKELRDRLRRQP